MSDKTDSDWPAIQIVSDPVSPVDPVAVTDPDLMSEAIVVWTGRGVSAWPDRDDGRLVERYGDQAAASLVVVLRALEREFNATDAHLTVSDLAEMGDIAASRFHSIHPELSEAAVEAMAWCYTYDWK